MKSAKILLLACLLTAISNPALAAPAAAANSSLNAPICAKCHQGESNMMLGFLKDVSFKANTILMDLLTHKEVVYFDDDSRVKNLQSLEDMRNYKGKGFRIYFAEEDGHKYATHITRFDILQLVDDKDKLALAEVENLMRADNSPVLVDVRPGKHFMAGHIEGAVNVPAPAFEKFKKNLPADKNKTLVIYGVGGCLSPSVAVNAMALGYDDVRIYTSGFPEWSKKHYGVAAAKYVKKGLADNSLVILDLRDAKLAEAGHIPGAVSAPLLEFKAIKDKLPANKKAPIILYGPQRTDAAAMLLDWGYKKIRLLGGDFAAWQSAGLPTEKGPLVTKIVYIAKAVPGTITVADFQALMKDSGDTTLIDVRNADEFAAGHLAGSKNIAVDDLAEQLSDIPIAKPVVVFCNSGVRAEMAYNILQGHGYRVRYLNALLKISAAGNVELEEK